MELYRSIRVKMKNLRRRSIKRIFRHKIKTEDLINYGVYQIEADGLNLFEYM